MSSEQKKEQKKCLCETPENSNFLKKGKIVISVKIRNFSRSRMTKRFHRWNRLAKIYLTRRILSNSETVGIDTFFEASRFGCCKMTCDVTKVTYNMYACYLYCMSRENDGIGRPR